MSHLGGAAIPVLGALVAGAVACALAFVDRGVFGRSRFGEMALAMGLVMVVFTAYHAILLVDHIMPETSMVFGSVVETVIAVGALVLWIERRERGEKHG